MEKQTILFWSRGQEQYQFLSNFYPSPMNLCGSLWPTVEHFYQAKRCVDPEEQEMIRNYRTAGEAKLYRPKNGFRDDWESVKDRYMARALYAKFDQNPDLAQMLLDTGDAILVHDTPWPGGDPYWGNGNKGRGGQNRQGQLLMQLREVLRKRFPNQKQEEEKVGTTIQCLRPDQFPERLSHIQWAKSRPCPKELYLEYCQPEACKLLDGPIVAIVGPREITEKGKEIIDHLVGQIASFPFKTMILSGLCPGADITAHRAALKYDLPTGGVLPYNKFYRERMLGEQILNAGGLMISEWSKNPGAHTRLGDLYNARNGIITALADVVIVIQAAKNSGSMNAAHQAHCQRKAIWVPLFPPTDYKEHPQMYEGVYELLRTRVAYGFNFDEVNMGSLQATIAPTK